MTLKRIQDGKPLTEKTNANWEYVYHNDMISKIQASNYVRPNDKMSFLIEKFSSSTGLNNLVVIGETTAVFDLNKYKTNGTDDSIVSINISDTYGLSNGVFATVERLDIEAGDSITFTLDKVNELSNSLILNPNSFSNPNNFFDGNIATSATKTTTSSQTYTLGQSFDKDFVNSVRVNVQHNGSDMQSQIEYSVPGWSETQPAGNVDTSWVTSSMSSDGQTIIAGVNVSPSGGRLYLSANSGSTWSEIQPVGNIDFSWLSSAMSSDGQTIVVGGGNQVFISANEGSTWSEITPPSTFNGPETLSMSSDGQIIIAGGVSSLFYISTNGGSTWTDTTLGGGSYFGSAMSSDGQTIVVGKSSSVNLSTNGGSTWSSITPPESVSTWRAFAVSSNGQKIISAGFNSQLWISTNGGSTWSSSSIGILNWRTVKMSSDGQTILASSTTRIYLSVDGGSTWFETQPAGDVNKSWNASSMSSDGLTIMAGALTGRLYLSNASLLDWVDFSGIILNGVGSIDETYNLNIFTRGIRVKTIVNTATSRTASYKVLNVNVIEETSPEFTLFSDTEKPKFLAFSEFNPNRIKFKLKAGTSPTSGGTSIKGIGTILYKEP